MKKCPFCAEDIQDEAIVCKHCGRDLQAQSSPPPPLPSATSPSKRKTSCSTLGCLGLLLGVVLLVIIGKIGENVAPSRVSQAAAPSSSNSDLDTILYAQNAGVNVRSAPKEDAPIIRRLALAERVVGVGREGEWIRLGGAEGQWVHSSVLGPNRPETPEEKKQRLAAEKQKVASERLAAKLTREIYAKTAREEFLDKGLDIKVRVSGSQSDRLVYEFVLFNDVWSHRFRKDGLIGQAAKLGFKRIEMTDGYNWNVYWDL
jgi:hypothetical protein